MATTNKLKVQMQQQLGAKLHKRTPLSKGCVARVCEWSKWGWYAQAKSRVQLQSGAHKMHMHAWCQVVMSRQAFAFLLARELLISVMARLSEQCVGHSLGGSTTRLQG